MDTQTTAFQAMDWGWIVFSGDHSLEDDYLTVASDLVNMSSPFSESVPPFQLDIFDLEDVPF